MVSGLSGLGIPRAFEATAAFKIRFASGVFGKLGSSNSH